MDASTVRDQDKPRLFLLVSCSQLLASWLRPLAVNFFVVNKSHVEDLFLAYENTAKVDRALWSILDDYGWDGDVRHKFEREARPFFNFNWNYGFGRAEAHILFSLILNVESYVLTGG